METEVGVHQRRWRLGQAEEAEEGKLLFKSCNILI